MQKQQLILNGYYIIYLIIYLSVEELKVVYTVLLFSIQQQFCELH